MNLYDIINWGSPLGIGLFMVCIAFAFYLFSLAVTRLAALDEKMKKR